MNKLLKCAGLALACVLAQGLCATSAAEKSCVWKVESESNTIYLAGEISFLREKDQPLPAAYDVAYEAVDRLVFEIDPAEARDEDQSRNAIMQGMFRDGGSLKDEVSAETYEKVGDFLEESGGQRDSMDRFRPWFAAIMIGMTETIKLGARPDLGVGRALEGRAIEDGKPVSGLEKSADEIKLFRQLPEGVPQYMLETTLARLDQIEQDFAEYVGAWRRGDIEKLLESDEGEDPKFEKLIDEAVTQKRNARWIGKIENVLAGDQPTMFVVGIAHLIEEKSLVERLEAKGYKVEQMVVEKEGEKKKPKLIPVAAPSPRA